MPDCRQCAPTGLLRARLRQHPAASRPSRSSWRGCPSRALVSAPRSINRRTAETCSDIDAIWSGVQDQSSPVRTSMSSPASSSDSMSSSHPSRAAWWSSTRGSFHSRLAAADSAKGCCDRSFGSDMASLGGSKDYLRGRHPPQRACPDARNGDPNCADQRSLPSAGSSNPLRFGAIRGAACPQPPSRP